jgi:hypothetical protein
MRNLSKIVGSPDKVSALHAPGKWSLAWAVVRRCPQARAIEKEM